MERGGDVKFKMVKGRNEKDAGGERRLDSNCKCRKMELLPSLDFLP